MDNSDNSPCGNPSCDKPGKSRCSKCSRISYCGAECQKLHWPIHKKICAKYSKDTVTPAAETAAAPAASSPTTVPASNPQQPTPQMQMKIGSDEVIEKLKNLKDSTQKAFQSKNFAASVDFGLQALVYANQLVKPAGLGEVIQLHLNLSNAYLQLQNMAEAENHATLAVTIADSGAAQCPGSGQAQEVQTVAYGNRAYIYVNLNKLDLAYENASRSLAIAETIYPKNDPHLHKSIRCLAVVKDRQQDLAEAEKLYLRAYTLLCIQPGPHSMDANQILDELIQHMTRKQDITGAEKYALSNYNALKDKKSQQERMVLADSAARLASLERRLNKNEEAEKHILQSLEIREELLANNNPIGIAFTILQLAGVQDAMGKYSDELEARVMRAAEIFARTRGPQSNEAKQAIGLLQMLKTKRQAQTKSSSAAEDLDDSEDAERPASPKVPNSSSSRILKMNTSVLNPAADDEFDKLRATLKPNDGVQRMVLADRYFNTQQFSYAEILILEALKLFLQEHGPEHQHTNAAKQNLLIAHNNSMNQLWMKVVAEELQKEEESKSKDDAAEEAEGGAAEAVPAQAAGGNDDDYSALMRKAAKMRASAPKSSGCIVC